MAVYAIFTYNITDPERYAKYIPGSAGIIFGTSAKHGGSVVFADGEAQYIQGDAKMMNVAIQFQVKKPYMHGSRILNMPKPKVTVKHHRIMHPFS